MNKILSVLLSLCIVALAIMPVQAYTAKSLAITVAPDGDAQVDIQYDLSLIEQTAVFLQLADPAGELKTAFDTHSTEPVTVSSATSSSALVRIPAFAEVNTGTSRVTIVTPALSFERAQQVMNEYWFAPLISPDFSPAVTTVTFPDGYRATYYDVLTVPSITHRISR
jgi:hypothetical protein